MFFEKKFRNKIKIKYSLLRKDFSFIFLINLILLIFNICFGKVNGFNIVQVAQIFRHGHRYSVYNFFNCKLNLISSNSNKTWGVN
jgi:hypothetical protein